MSVDGRNSNIIVASVSTLVSRFQSSPNAQFLVCTSEFSSFWVSDAVFLLEFQMSVCDVPICVCAAEVLFRISFALELILFIRTHTNANVQCMYTSNRLHNWIISLVKQTQNEARRTNTDVFVTFKYENRIISHFSAIFPFFLRCVCRKEKMSRYVVCRRISIS